jgi:hypothetical protein
MVIVWYTVHPCLNPVRCRRFCCLLSLHSLCGHVVFQVPSADRGLAWLQLASYLYGREPVCTLAVNGFVIVGGA